MNWWEWSLVGGAVVAAVAVAFGVFSRLPVNAPPPPPHRHTRGDVVRWDTTAHLDEATYGRDRWYALVYLRCSECGEEYIQRAWEQL